MTVPSRKMSDMLKEMSERLLRSPDDPPSAEAACIALMFANIAWNEGVGLVHPRDSYRSAWGTIEAENPDVWGDCPCVGSTGRFAPFTRALRLCPG